MSRLPLALALASLLVLPLSADAQVGMAIEDLANQTMKSWQIPGMALVVVKDNKIAYLNGFGVREVGKEGAVTPTTLFPIASCTKSFTTLALGMLADEGKLGWDDHVRKHVPFFQLSDPLADTSVTLRDLVSHRTGVAAHDLLWYGSNWDLEQRVRQAAKLELDKPFRASFRYQVVYFGAAGLAVGTASKTTWADFVQTRILDALEMKASRCTLPETPGPNIASPHRKERDGKVIPIARFPLERPDPAGSIHSTAQDLANYLRFQTGNGTWKGKRLISAEQMDELHSPQVVLQRRGALKALNPETIFLHYGLGWIVQDYRGKKMLMHGGSIDGFRAHLTLVPEAKLGIALLNNLDGGLANVALSNSIVDLFLDRTDRDWIAYYLDLFEQGEKAEQERSRMIRAKRDPMGPPRPLASYLGVYEDAAYGSCKIEREGDSLIWVWQKVRCPLEHFRDDIFLANQGPLVDTPFVFAEGGTGKVESLRTLGRRFQRK